MPGELPSYGIKECWTYPPQYEPDGSASVRQPGRCMEPRLNYGDPQIVLTFDAGLDQLLENFDTRIDSAPLDGQKFTCLVRASCVVAFSGPVRAETAVQTNISSQLGNLWLFVLQALSREIHVSHLAGAKVDVAFGVLVLLLALEFKTRYSFTRPPAAEFIARIKERHCYLVKHPDEPERYLLLDVDGNYESNYSSESISSSLPGMPLEKHFARDIIQAVEYCYEGVFGHILITNGEHHIAIRRRGPDLFAVSRVMQEDPNGWMRRHRELFPPAHGESAANEYLDGTTQDSNTTVDNGVGEYMSTRSRDEHRPRDSQGFEYVSLTRALLAMGHDAIQTHNEHRDNWRTAESPDPIGGWDDVSELH